MFIMADKIVFIDYELKKNDIVNKAEECHSKFYQFDGNGKLLFRGPSLYFHRRAIDLCRKAWLSESHLEMVYAVLVSWGMHRMGKGGSKMVYFDDFKKSIADVKNDLGYLRRIDDPKEMNKVEWTKLKNVFDEIKVMESTTTIVGNSKALAHILPNIIAPIDRQYTMQFLYESKYIKNGLENEWYLMKEIHEYFFYPIVKDSIFSNLAEDWLSNNKFKWDTSFLKVVDNLVIGHMILTKKM
jgi:hypothetical protein